MQLQIKSAIESRLIRFLSTVLSDRQSHWYRKYFSHSYALQRKRKKRNRTRCKTHSRVLTYLCIVQCFHNLYTRKIFNSISEAKHVVVPVLMTLCGDLSVKLWTRINLIAGVKNCARECSWSEDGRTTREFESYGKQQFFSVCIHTTSIQIHFHFHSESAYSRFWLMTRK